MSRQHKQIIISKTIKLTANVLFFLLDAFTILHTSNFERFATLFCSQIDPVPPLAQLVAFDLLLDMPNKKGAKKAAVEMVEVK